MNERESHEATAFCMSCPDPEEVGTVLRSLDLHLVFQMDAVMYPPYSHTADLPAQYHYGHSDGTEVIYLAGRDTPMDGVRFPPHASRWWLVPGANPSIFQQVGDALETLWQLSWQSVGQGGVCEASSAA